LGVQVIHIYNYIIILLKQIEEVKVEKKVEKKAVVKVEVKKGDNRYFGLKGTVPPLSFAKRTRVSKRTTLFCCRLNGRHPLPRPPPHIGCGHSYNVYLFLSSHLVFLLSVSYR
jgi:hypothetical protein